MHREPSKDQIRRQFDIEEVISRYRDDEEKYLGIAGTEIDALGLRKFSQGLLENGKLYDALKLCIDSQDAFSMLVDIRKIALDLNESKQRYEKAEIAISEYRQIVHGIARLGNALQDIQTGLVTADALHLEVLRLLEEAHHKCGDVISAWKSEYADAYFSGGLQAWRGRASGNNEGARRSSIAKALHRVITPYYRTPNFPRWSLIADIMKTMESEWESAGLSGLEVRGLIKPK